ncbi:MAG: helix-turn-helix transcriptional regulator [Acidimicrobiaceae bacterium]|nr:helix-turn-helix transcriptional regulator [Acidimicrobiaceae bacterium]
MLTQGEVVEVHALKERGWTITTIANHLGHDRKTIRAYLKGERVRGTDDEKCGSSSCRVRPECGRYLHVVARSSDLTTTQWKILESVFMVPSKLGPEHGAELCHVLDAMLYISRTGYQWSSH